MISISYSTFFVATISTPVSATFLRITSPIWTGAETSIPFSAFTQSKIFPFGISSLVFTDTISMLPPATRTVEVTILVGLVTSFLAYTPPRLQVFPVTLTTSSPFITTVRGHAGDRTANTCQFFFFHSLCLLNLYRDRLQIRIF